MSVEQPPPAPTLAAATPVDTDTGPAYVLEGDLVTMNPEAEVIPGGRLAISRGRIVAVLHPGEELPEALAAAPQHATGGTIYPGLVDLHNHFVYNVLPLWAVPRRYQNRTQWPRADGYAGGVSLPVRALAEAPSTARALVRYVEGKALIGGTTTGQGMRTRVEGGARLFRGAMRNVEETGDPALPEAGTRVPNLFADEEGVRSFRAALDRRRAYLYHLAEGVDAAARRTFTDLVDNELLDDTLVGIHCLGLEPGDLVALGQAGAKAVWSPFSNLLLYGRTIDVAALVDAGVPCAIGCDWSPTGSKNLLQELKVARWAARSQGAALPDVELVRAVTSTAAQAVGWGGAVGALAPGAYADLLVLRDAERSRGRPEPYARLVDAVEGDVGLVMVHGLPRYGDRDLMQSVHAATGHDPRTLEDVEVAGRDKAFFLHAEGSSLNDLGWAEARATLEAAMDDLPGFRDASQAERDQARLAGVGPELTVELDNEWELTPDDMRDLGVAEPRLAADWDQLVPSLPLDTPEVGPGDYWERIRAQPNLPGDLKDDLEGRYGR
jgi:5-methylthioadenosine/S-adenosylhomocysteine deaminase